MTAPGASFPGEWFRRRTYHHSRFSDLGALVRDRLMVAARIDGRGSAWHFTGTTHCDAFVAAVWVLQAVKAQASKRPPNRIDLVTILGM